MFYKHFDKNSMMGFFSINQTILNEYTIRQPKLHFPLQEVEKVLSEDQQAYINIYVKNFYYFLNQKFKFIFYYTQIYFKTNRFVYLVYDLCI